MPSQDILVVIDSEAGVERRLALVGALAKCAEIRVTGMYVSGVPATLAFADLDGWAQLYDAFITAQRAEAMRAERAFRAALARLSLPGDWHYRESDMTEGVIAMARLHDLVVMGQPDPDAIPSGLRPGEVALAAGRPALIIPYAGEFAEIGRHVLVAWNGSREAARALHDAMFLIDGAEAVTVLEIDPAEGADGDPELRASHVVAALARRGVAAKAETMVSAGVPIAEMILSVAADRTADLIVMGAWGHSRLREFVMGGASRGILQAMAVPVLMSH